MRPFRAVRRVHPPVVVALARHESEVDQGASQPGGIVVESGQHPIDLLFAVAAARLEGPTT
jgi:hypothetical protein